MRRSGRGAASTAVWLSLWALSAASCGTSRRGGDPRPGAASGTLELYVSPQGDDGQDGSLERPWRTIAHAASQVGPGSTVHVAAGEYSGPLVLRTGGKPGQRIRFISDTRWGARITATSSGPVGIVQVAGDYVDVEGFDVSGRGGDGTVGILVPGSHVRIAGNHVHDVLVGCHGGPNGGGGIVAGGGTPDYRNHDIEVSGNLVHDVVGTPTRRCAGVQGIYASVARVRIVNNVSYRNGHDCITSWHAASRLTIANNTVLDCPAAGITVGSGGPGATSRGNFDTTVANNIVLRNAQGIVETSDGTHRLGPGNRYLDNLVFGSGDRPLSRHIRSRGAVVSGTMHADPRLMGPGAQYRPTAASPAIDAGTATGAPGWDFDGVHRPQGRHVDIGAFEWRGARARTP